VEVVTVTQTKRNWGRLLSRVERGDSFLITRNGRPVAVLEPSGPTAHAPIVPLFTSGDPDLAARADELLDGFGER
jgi:prevent-host-death family protein